MLRAAIRTWQQPDGLVSNLNYPGPDSTGNGLLYTSLYYIALYNRGELEDRDAKEFQDLVTQCSAHNRSFYGLLNRSPTKKYEQTAYDDYVAVTLASKLLGLNDLAWVIVNWGNQRRFLLFKWLYNNLVPIEFTLQSWMGRRIDAVAHIQSCVDVISVNYLRLLYLFLYILFGSTKGHHQSIIIRYIYGKHSRYKMIRWAWSRFEKKVVKQYNLGMRQVIAKELGDLHPIVVYWV